MDLNNIMGASPSNSKYFQATPNPKILVLAPCGKYHPSTQSPRHIHLYQDIQYLYLGNNGNYNLESLSLSIYI